MKIIINNIEKIILMLSLKKTKYGHRFIGNSIINYTIKITIDILNSNNP
jgi:hypothetical protein